MQHLQETRGGYSSDSETRHPLISRHCTKPLLFIPLRTLLHSSKTQLLSFQSFPHSLPKTTRVGGTHQSLPHYLLASLSRFPQSPACPDLVGVINRCIIPPREHPAERSRMPCPGLPHRKRNHPPEYYPLSLNALVNACNQKSNRDPVMNLDEAAVRQALHSLDGQSLVRSVSASDSRVTKHEHRLQEAFNFYRHEVAILCVLLLRGPQTPGELRTRAERMHTFDDLSAVQSSLQHLMKREPPLVKVLPRQPGTKEARYAHLLSGDVEVSESKLEIPAIMNASSPDGERIALLEKEVATLRDNAADFQKEIADLRQQFAQFKKQFE